MTVLGRVIGHYVPVSVAIDDRFIAGLRPGEPASRPGQDPVAESSGSSPAPGRPEAPEQSPGDSRRPAPRMTQADKDKVLRRVAGGKG